MATAPAHNTVHHQLAAPAGPVNFAHLEHAIIEQDGPDRCGDTAFFVAPSRFDVHAIDGFLLWADRPLANGNDLVIDLRVVDFMDQHMVDALDELAARAAEHGCRVELAHLSAAAALTLELLQRVAA